MSVHYKFKSALDYDTVTFDGLHISVGELKTAISQQKRIGKTSDFDLQITNAQTKEVYSDDQALIPKNTSLLVARIPLAQQPKKPWHGDAAASAGRLKDVGHTQGLADLSRMEGSEQDKINAMISQSTLDYDPSNYQKIRGQNQRGVVPQNYRCHRCKRPGHWIKNCPIIDTAASDSVEIRRSTGIPQSFMVPVDGPKAPGAMMTPTGSFAVPAVDHEAYQASETGGGEPAPESERRVIPDDLICSLCRDLLTDAVMIPCCGNSFCDECIRGALLESEDHECPDCREKEISPTTLIPNRFLRNSVASFRNQTGYSRRAPHRPPAAAAAPPPAPLAEQPPPSTSRPPPNGQSQPGQPIAVSTGVGAAGATGGAGGAGGAGDESDASGEDNITVTVPPPSGNGGQPPRHRSHRPRRPYDEPPADRPRADTQQGDTRRGDRPPYDRQHGDRAPHERRGDRPHAERYGPPPGMQLLDRERQSGPPHMMSRMLEERRAGTPTVDEQRDASNPQMMYGRPPPMYMQGPPGTLPPGVGPPPRFAGAYGPRDGPPGMPPYVREPFLPEPYQPPPPGIKESPTLRRDEDPLEAFNRMIREKEERAKRRETERRRLHSPSPRSPARSPPRSPVRSPPLSRSPPPQRSPPPRVRSPPPPRARSPRSRSPPPRARTPPSRASSRLRYTRSRSISRGRVRRSPPWSPRRRPLRERTLSLTRSPSPRRRRSPPRYRSPLRSPGPRPRSPHRPVLRTPPPHHSPPHHRYAAGFEERASPPRRNVEPPYGARYGSRSNGPPPYPAKLVTPLADLAMMKDPSPEFRGRYDEPPFVDIPPGADPPVPGYEPPPFDNPMITPGIPDLDRMPSANFRESPFHRGPYGDMPPSYRDMAPAKDGSMHIRDQPPGQYRDGFRGPIQQPPFRESVSGPPSYRDGQSFRNQAVLPQQFREGNPNANYRGGPPVGFRDNGPSTGYRNNSIPPYREGAPPQGYRDMTNHGFRDGPPGSFRPQNIRDVPRAMVYTEPNVRDIPPLMAEPIVGRDQMRGGYRHGNRNARGANRRNFDGDRHRDRTDREGRERYDRENADKGDRKMLNNYDRARDERSRDYDRNRDVPDKEREHTATERSSPDRKRKVSSERTPPRRSRVVDTRDKRKSESRGQSKDRDSRRDRKEEKERDRSVESKHKDKDQKEKVRKEKERKKKKKDRDLDKKRKRDKKEKKEKDVARAEGDDIDKEPKLLPSIKEEPHIPEESVERSDDNNRKQVEEKPNIDNDLYGDVGKDVAVDKTILETYIKTEPFEIARKSIEAPAKEEKDSSFEGLELQATGDELDLKLDENEKEMLAPVPELSKWEKEEDPNDKREPGEISPETENTGKVTSEVIKRAENAIFTKAINSIKTIEIKKISNDRVKLYSDESGDHKEPPMNNIQITVPVTNIEHRSIELSSDKKPKRSKTPILQKLSVKDRLGGKVEEPTRNRDERFVQSTVERIKSRSKTPKRDHPYRRVTVDTRDRSRRVLSKVEEAKDPHRHDKREERRIISESMARSDVVHHRKEKPESEMHRSPTKDKAKKKEHKPKKSKDEKHHKEEKHSENKGDEKAKSDKDKEMQQRPDRDRKKSTLDEANFEPDYDEHVETDNEGKEENTKKRERSSTPVQLGENAAKKPKTDEEVADMNKTHSGTDSSTDTDSSSTSSSSEARRKKRKKKKSKRKKKKVASDSESDSEGSSSDEPKKKKKKSKHKKKSSKKKKKKSKHK